MNMKVAISAVCLLAGGLAGGMNGQDNSAASVLKSVKAESAPDTRVAVWDVSASGDKVSVISGEVDNPAAKAALFEEFDRKGIKYEDRLVVLPDATVKSPWAVVSISVACLRGEARSGAELVSQAIMGTPMRVLQVEDGMARVQTPDNYIGYMTESSFVYLSEEEMAAWRGSRRMVVTSSLSVMFESPDGNEATVVSDLLLGNILALKGEKDGYYLLEIPDGRKGYVRKSDVSDVETWAAQPFDMGVIERNARRMMGTPYLWGGMSAKMADCSGFVRTSYFSNGIILQRDASQQALTGEKVDWRKWRTDARPGDLIFIGTKAGRVTHVAMYLGGGKYIHSSGRVKINSMDPAEPDYLDYVFLSMSRINGSVGTKGIVAVKSHPWYFNQD